MLLTAQTVPGVFSGTAYNNNLAIIEASMLDTGPWVISGLVPTPGVGLSVSVSAGVASIGGRVSVPAPIVIAGLVDSTTNHLYLLNSGAGTSNTTGIQPANSVKLGDCAAVAGAIVAVDITRGSGRQQFRQPQDLIHGGGGSGLAGHPRSVDLSSWGASPGNGFEVSGLLPAGAAGNSIKSGTVAARPAAGNAGAEYLPNDGIYVYRDNGSLWQPWGPVWPVVEPISANFAGINMGAATLDTTRGGIYLFAPANAATNMRVQKMAAPATPYTITAAFLPAWAPDAGTFPTMGLVFRESSTGKLVSLGYQLSTTPRLVPSKWTSPTVFSTAYTPLWDGIGNMRTGPLVWLQITDTGTNLLFSASNSGRLFYTQYTISRTDWMAGGPNEVGFYVNSNQATYDSALWLLHWAVS
jgi:hypothetical protein